MNDNAFMESFFNNFKTERLKRRVFDTVGELRSIIIEYIRYYNFDRPHSSINHIAPHDFESRLCC